MNGIHRLNDPLRQRLSETDARMRVADGALRQAIEHWVLVRAAYGCPAPPGLIQAMAGSGMLGNEVLAYVTEPGEERSGVDQ